MLRSFGSENVKFRSFEEACKSEIGLVGDFFSSVGIHPNNILPMKANVSISNDAVFILSYLNSLNVKLETEGINILSSIDGTKG